MAPGMLKAKRTKKATAAITVFFIFSSLMVRTAKLLSMERANHNHVRSAWPRHCVWSKKSIYLRIHLKVKFIDQVESTREIDDRI
jgi:hypothetical protein